MRNYNADYYYGLQLNTIEPRFTFEINFESDFSDPVYILSHDDSATPFGAVVISSRLKNGNLSSQRLAKISSVGTARFEAVDVLNSFTDLLNQKILAGKGLRLKRLKIYKGLKGLDFDKYELQAVHAFGKMNYKNGLYSVEGFDITRVAKDKYIFDPATTSLAANIPSPKRATLTTGFLIIDGAISVNSTDGFDPSGSVMIGKEIIDYVSKTATTFTGLTHGAHGTIAVDHAVGDNVIDTWLTISATNTNDFDLLEHDEHYSDAPNLEVGYFTIEKEIYRYHGKSGGTFTGCIRGALNSYPVGHTNDPGASSDNALKIEEYIYIEMNIIKLMYAVLLGALYGQSGKSFPPGWTANIDPEFIRATDFTSIGSDLWNPTTNEGFVVKFEGLTKTTPKEFFEKKILEKINCFMPVSANGEWGLKRRIKRGKTGAHVIVLDDQNIKSYGALEYDPTTIKNYFIPRWNWSVPRKEFTRKARYFLSESVGVHGISDPYNIDLDGITGDRHTKSNIKRIIGRLMDEKGNPEYRTEVELLPMLEALEVGDAVRYKPTNVIDFNADGLSIDRIMEVTEYNLDLIDGGVKVKLEGIGGDIKNKLKADSVVVMPDGAYVGLGGTNINTITNYSAGNINASDQLTGGDDYAVWHHVGDLTIGSAANLKITKNVMIAVEGHLQINGTIDGKGNGLPGIIAPSEPTNVNPYPFGSIGGVGVVRAHRAVQEFHGNHFLGRTEVFVGSDTADNWDTDQTSAINKIGSSKDIEWDGTTLKGLPKRLYGAPGIYGIGVVDSNLYDVTGVGGNGGASGAGLIIVCRGLTFGASGKIDLSGKDGIIGGTMSYLSRNIYKASGSGGNSGNLIIVIDGADSTIDTLTTGNCILKNGVDPIPAGSNEFYEWNYNLFFGDADDYFPPSPVSFPKHYDISPQNKTDSLAEVYYLQDNLPVEPEPLYFQPQPPTNFTVASHEPHLITELDGTQRPRIYASWIASTDVKVDRYFIYKRRSAGGWVPFSPENISEWEKSEREPSRTDTYAYIEHVTQGVIYDIAIVPINIWGEKGLPVYQLNHTVVGKSSPPSPPSSLYAVSEPGAVKLVWTNASDKDITRVHVYWSFTNVRPGSPQAYFPVAELSQEQSYSAVIQPGTVKYFWVGHGDSSGNASTSTFPAGANAGIVGTAGQFVYLDSTPIDDLKPAVAGADVNSPSISLRVNKTSLTTVNNGEAFIHGFDSSGAPADVDGYINFNGNKLTVPRSESGTWTIATQTVGAGYIIFDTTKSGKFTVSSQSVSLAFAKKVNGSWSYDNNTGNWIAFTPSATDTVIGTLVTDSADSIKTGEVWANGISPDVVADGGATVSRVFVQTSPPSALVATDEDVWIDSDDNNKLYVRESGTWVSRRDPTADWNNVDLIPEAELFSVDDSSRLGYNPGFANWSAGKPQNWNATGTNHFEENTIRQMGSSSVKFVTDGTTDETLTFINSTLFTNQNAPLSAGTFLIVSFAYYLTEITGAGRPGVSMILYTSGVAKYYDIEIENTALDVWHQQYFIARANAGTIIQGIEMEVAGASSFMPNGRADCTVYFDKCGFNIIDGDSLAYDDGTRLHDLKPAEVSSDVTGNHVFDSMSSNLVVDGDMERADTTRWANTGVTKNVDAAEGTYSLDVANPGNYATNKQPDGTLLFINVEEGDKINIKARAKNVGSGVALLGINLATGSKGFIGTQYVAQAGSTSWELIEGSFTIPAASTIRYVNAVLVNGGGGASARFDQVEMIKAPRTIGKGATAILTVDQAVATAYNHAISFNAHSQNDKINGQYIHDNVTNNSRLTVPTGVSKVKMTAKASFLTRSGGYRKLAIYKGGSPSYTGSTGANVAPVEGTYTTINLSTPILEVVPGDFFSLVATHNTGADLSIDGVADGSGAWFHMEVVE